MLFRSNDTATTEIYTRPYTLSLHDALPIGSSNPYNMVRATFDALKHQDSPRSVAARRNIKVSTLQSRRVGGDAEVVAE